MTLAELNALEIDNPIKLERHEVENRISQYSR